MLNLSLQDHRLFLSKLSILLVLVLLVAHVLLRDADPLGKELVQVVLVTHHVTIATVQSDLELVLRVSKLDLVDSSGDHASLVDLGVAELARGELRVDLAHYGIQTIFESANNL